MNVLQAICREAFCVSILGVDKYLQTFGDFDQALWIRRTEKDGGCTFYHNSFRT